jgi:ketosteroid isomerase-like protein
MESEMMMEEKNVALVRAYIAAIERFDVETLGQILHPDIVQTEYPNKLYAAGQVRGREQMLRDLPKGAKVLRSQEYPIESIFAAGDKVTVETRWEGIVNVPLGRLQPGDAMVAHICMIFTLKDGRIVAQKNYDCYEDFAAAA